MLLSLKSDFRDYYDDGFDREERVPHYSLQRRGHRVAREQMLRYLSSHQGTLLYQNVVPHGKVKTFESSPLVVYTDDFSANGSGMELMTVEKARETYPNSYATLFLYNGGNSTKHVVVGKKNYLFAVSSKNNWKSTVGDSTRTLLSAWDSEDYHPQFPLYTVSYVDLLQKKFAIKLNVAPKIGYLESWLPKEEVIRQIRGFYA